MKQREHWKMFSLHSDFLRHSLIILLGPAELRMFVLNSRYKVLCIVRLIIPCSNSPRARLRRVPSKNDSGRLNLPMSLNPSSNAHFIFIYGFKAITKKDAFFIIFIDYALSWRRERTFL